MKYQPVSPWFKGRQSLPMPTESQLQRTIMSYLIPIELRGDGYWNRTNTGTFKTVRPDQSTGYVKSGRRGQPDITGCYKGHYIAIEVKTIKGKQSDAQLQAQTMIEKAGGQYWIIHSVEELNEHFKQLKPIMKA